MMKQLGLAGFSLLLLVSVAGCEKVGKCKRGEDGCLGGKPDDNGECAAGLVSRLGECVEPKLPGYCDNADKVPETRLVAPSCTPRSSEGELPFAEICRRRCLQQCRRSEVICEGYECQRDCSTRAELEECRSDCPQDTEEEASACLTASCQAVQKQRCDAFTCPTGNPRNCDDVKCADSCTNNTDDTFCDDGDPSSALYSLCAFGTDCSDCGPRRGVRPASAPIQGLCPGGRDVACQGYNDDYTKNEAFCVHVEGTQDGQFSCVEDCTNDDEECPDGFECQALVFMNGEPYEDLSNVQGYACFPTFCGN